MKGTYAAPVPLCKSGAVQRVRSQQGLFEAAPGLDDLPREARAEPGPASGVTPLSSW